MITIATLRKETITRIIRRTKILIIIVITIIIISNGNSSNKNWFIEGIAL